MRYNIPGHSHVTLYRDSHEVVFSLPYPADGPDADLLAAYPLVRLVADKREPAPEPAPEEKPAKPSRKEV